MDKRNYIFIVNPVSGTGKQKGIGTMIQARAAHYGQNAVVEYTKYAGHASEIAANAAAHGAYAVVVVGGDGSVNETGKALLHSATVMGIVPTGSGNGLARHLKIPLNLRKAVDNAFTGTVRCMDAGKLGEHIFLSTAGFGFDAKVAHEFAKQKKRGFNTYIKTVRKTLFKYKPFQYAVKGETAQLTGEAFMLLVANIPQFGNNFTVNPGATENDGLLNCTVIRPFPRYKSLGIAGRFFSKRIHKSKYFSEIIGTAFDLRLPHTYAHVDGEPIMLNEKTCCAEIIRSSLHVIAGR